MLRIYIHSINALSSAKARVSKLVAGVRDDESGATAIEYGLIAAGIAVAIIGVVFTLGNEISGFFAAVETKLSAVNPG